MTGVGGGVWCGVVFDFVVFGVEGESVLGKRYKIGD